MKHALKQLTSRITFDVCLVYSQHVYIDLYFLDMNVGEWVFTARKAQLEKLSPMPGHEENLP